MNRSNLMSAAVLESGPRHCRDAADRHQRLRTPELESEQQLGSIPATAVKHDKPPMARARRLRVGTNSVGRNELEGRQADHRRRLQKTVYRTERTGAEPCEPGSLRDQRQLAPGVVFETETSTPFVRVSTCRSTCSSTIQITRRRRCTTITCSTRSSTTTRPAMPTARPSAACGSRSPRRATRTNSLWRRAACDTPSPR